MALVDLERADCFQSAVDRRRSTAGLSELSTEISGPRGADGLLIITNFLSSLLYSTRLYFRFPKTFNFSVCYYIFQHTLQFFLNVLLQLIIQQFARQTIVNNLTSPSNLIFVIFNIIRIFYGSHVLNGSSIKKKHPVLIVIIIKFAETIDQNQRKFTIVRNKNLLR